MNEKSAIQLYLKQQQTLFGNDLFFRSANTANVDKTLLSNRENFSSDLNQFCNSICLCQECPLGITRNNFVFGVGDPSAELMLIGEAPGEKEDQKGEPFVGRSGKLLDKILRAINKTRNKGVYIANILKCRPPNNRDPLASEVEKCEPYLLRQIELIKPKLIVSLGRVSGKTLLKRDDSLKKMRNALHDYHGIPLKVTYHPAALLRNPNLKKNTWEDFKWVRDYLAK